MTINTWQIECMDDSGRPTDSKKVRQKLLLYLLIDVCVNELHMIRLCNSSRPAEPSGPFPRLLTHHQSSCSLCFMSLLSLLSRLLRVVTFKFRSLLLEEEASSSSSPLEMTTIKRCSPFPPMLFQASFVCHSWAHVFFCVVVVDFNCQRALGMSGGGLFRAVVSPLEFIHF